jgi:hypothetical protein
LSCGAILVIALWLPLSVAMASPVAVSGSSSSTLVLTPINTYTPGFYESIAGGTAIGSNWDLIGGGAVFCGDGSSFYLCSGGTVTIVLQGVLTNYYLGYNDAEITLDQGYWPITTKPSL